jgi:hypothetical protein
MLTFESLFVGHPAIAATAILLLAFFKARIIGLEFMELRHAPLPLRIGLEIWVIAACATLLSLYWKSPA